MLGLRMLPDGDEDEDEYEADSEDDPDGFPSVSTPASVSVGPEGGDGEGGEKVVDFPSAGPDSSDVEGEEGEEGEREGEEDGTMSAPSDTDTVPLVPLASSSPSLALLKVTEKVPSVVLRQMINYKHSNNTPHKLKE